MMYRYCAEYCRGDGERCLRLFSIPEVKPLVLVWAQGRDVLDDLYFYWALL